MPVPVPDYREGLGEGVENLRIGVPREQFFGLLDPEVRVAVEEAVGVFVALGAEVVDVDSGFTREALGQAWSVCNAEGQAYHAEWIATRFDDYGPDLQVTMRLPLPHSKGLADAYRASYDIKEGVRRLFDRMDVLLTPTATRAASVIGEEEVLVDGHKMTTFLAFAQLTMPFHIGGR